MLLKDRSRSAGRQTNVVFNDFRFISIEHNLNFNFEEEVDFKFNKQNVMLLLFSILTGKVRHDSTKQSHFEN